MLEKNRPIIVKKNKLLLMSEIRKKYSRPSTLKKSTSVKSVYQTFIPDQTPPPLPKERLALKHTVMNRKAGMSFSSSRRNLNSQHHQNLNKKLDSYRAIPNLLVPT